MPAVAYPTLLELRRLPAFRPLRLPQIVSLVRAGARKRPRKGTVLSSPDEHAGAIWLVLEGSVRIERPGMKAEVLEAPVDVGLLPLLAELPSAATVTAAERLKAIEVPVAHVLDVLDANPSHRLRLAAELGEALDELRGGRPLLEGGPLERFPEGDDDEGRFAEALFRLTRVAPTAGADVSQLVSLARRLEPLQAAPGEPLLEGSTHACILIEGTAELALGGLRLPAGPGAHLGWVEALADRELPYESTARTAVRGLRYERTALLAAVRHWPAVARVVLRHLARGLVAADPRALL